MKSINICLFILLFVQCNSFNPHIFNFNTIIPRSLDDSIINFIKIDNVNNMKIKYTSKYLVLKYEDNINLMHQDNNDLYNIIKTNKKPILFLYDKKIINTTFKYRHTYLIKNRNNYIFKYNYMFNNQHHKYLFDIYAIELNKYETYWNISASFNIRLKDIIELSKISIINWFCNSIDNSSKNYFYKKYLLFQYLTNIL
jgi:hypothetical protein